MMIISLFALLVACDGGGDAEPSTTTAHHGPTTPTASTATAPVKAPSAPASSAYSGRFAADPLLTPQQVALIPPDQMRLARNEVYARHGRPFQSADLQAHFKATGWYTERADYSDSMLTKNDTANATLIQSFEGDDARKKAIARGEYTGETGMGIVFVDAATAEVLDGSGDIYNWTRESRHWTALGEWVVTWEGGAATWSPTNPDMRSVQLWKLNHTDGQVVEVWPLVPQQG